MLNRPYRQRELAVHVLYGKEMELRLLAPETLDADIDRIVRPLVDRAIDDVGDLVGRLGKLAALGCEVTVYPDAEELINRRLFAARIASKVAEIRKNPERTRCAGSCSRPSCCLTNSTAWPSRWGRRSILADDMGLGKTIQGIGVAELLAREAGISKVLIVCPASVKSQWRGEIERFCTATASLCWAAPRAGPAI